MAMEAVAQAGTRIIQILGIRAMGTVKKILDQVTVHTTTPPQVGEVEVGHITAVVIIIVRDCERRGTDPQVISGVTRRL